MHKKPPPQDEVEKASQQEMVEEMSRLLERAYQRKLEHLMAQAPTVPPKSEQH